MRKTFLSALLAVMTVTVLSQKPALDHSVYDAWESISERLLSPDGKYLVYSVVPQEGDGRLVIRSTASDYAKEIPRGANPTITADGRWLVCSIKPLFKDTREAKIRKKMPEQMPKDSLAWLELGKDSVTRIPQVKSSKVPDKQGSWLAYLLEKGGNAVSSDSTHKAPDSTTRIRQMIARADSLSRLADSLRKKAGEIGLKGFGKEKQAPPKTKADEKIEEGTTLVLRDLATGREQRFALVSEYSISRNGRTAVIETTRKNGDTLSKAAILWVSLADGKIDTVMRGFNDAKSYALDEQGGQLAFVAERDSVARALVKFYRLWYYTPGMDSAVVKADRSMMAASLSVSPDYANNFSKDGMRLFLGLAPVRPPKDTNRVDFETARLDIWNYKDELLSPQQLVQLNNELKRSYLSVISQSDGRLVQLGNDTCESVRPSLEGDGRYALGASNKGYRIQEQWEGDRLQNIYVIDIANGSRKLVQRAVRGGASISPAGKFITWYDWKKKHWFSYSIAAGRTTNITAGIRVPLYDEEDDHPDDPPPHGVMTWLENDESVYVYDRYDIWQCDPEGKAVPFCITGGKGRLQHRSIRYHDLGKEENYIKKDEQVLLTIFDTREMKSALQVYRIGTPYTPLAATHPASYNNLFRAKQKTIIGYLKGSYDKPYDVYVADSTGEASGRQYSHINPQQAKYNWYTVSLHHWKMLDGRNTEGLLYKPENFDSTKKYPIIFYFYERDVENMYQYNAPMPVRSIINIPYFTSNGYLVFDPDIWYKTGAPGEDAYNSIMSAVNYLSKFKWVDTTRMGLEGHSWGGYQTAYLVTRTNRFAAAEAGAPVANMTSAYGGIRWGTGISRQFQYERSQSRIGASLWQRPDLYIKSSPLFRADRVETPLLMMHNDLDGAVPWYQGIEYFTALKRLGKKVWLLQYNGEDHGLLERRNRKDWSIRLGQFFDCFLKGAPAAKWITEGVPATMKGIDWGLGTD